MAAAAAEVGNLFAVQTMADASTVPSILTCWRLSEPTFAAVTPIATVGALV
jgi:hypothetical protein